MQKRYFSIRTKLYSVIAFLLVIMMFISFLRAQQISEEMNTYNETINSTLARKEYMIDIVLALDNLLVDNLVIAYAYYDGAGPLDTTELLEISMSNKDKILTNLYLYREEVQRDTFLSKEDIQAHLMNIDHTINAFMEDFIPAMQDLRFSAYIGNQDGVIHNLTKLLPAGNNAFTAEMLALRDKSFEFTAIALQNMNMYYQRQQNNFWISMGLGLILAMSVSAWIVRGIRSSIAELTFAMGKVKEGNLHYPIRNGHKDEFGQLSNDIASMVENISEINKAATIADYLHTMILVKDMQDNVVYTNNTFAEAYRIDKESSLDLKLSFDVLKKYTDYLIIPTNENETRAHFGFTWEPVLEKWITGSIVLRKWTDGRMVYCYYINDSTERKRYHDQRQEYEEELRESIRREREATAAKNDFIANTSHEIRTPMNSIVGYSELALDDQTLPDNTREYISRIVTNAEWLLNIISDIMDFSKIESGKLEIEQAPFDLKSIMEHCKHLVMPEANLKGVDVHFFIDSFPEEKLVGDRVRLSQVCINLLSNAIKFTNVGSVIFTVTRVSRKNDKCILEFNVSDTGIGMSPEQMKKIFDPFVQADSSTTRKYGGTGLGLAISKKIIENMGGQLKLRSVINRGSEFKFRLEFPTIKLSDEAKLDDAIARPKFKDKSVMVVEDNEMNQAVIYEHLKRVGIVPDIRRNGQEAVDYVCAQMKEKETVAPYDLILMDINMPVMDGIDATKLLRASGLTSPIVAITANMVSPDSNEYEEYGMDGYITKPFTSKQLWRVLVKHITPESYESGEVQTNDERFVQKMKVDFVARYQDFYEELVAVLANKEMDKAYSLAHNLKSNSGYIGEHGLLELAKLIEHEIKEGYVDNAVLEKLQVELEKTMVALAPNVQWAENERCKAEAQVKEKNISKSEMAQILTELSELLDENNMEVMMYIEKLYAIPNTHQLICEIEDLNFKEAKEELTTILDEL